MTKLTEAPGVCCGGKGVLTWSRYDLSGRLRELGIESAVCVGLAGWQSELVRPDSATDYRNIWSSATRRSGGNGSAAGSSSSISDGGGGSGLSSRASSRPPSGKLPERTATTVTTTVEEEQEEQEEQEREEEEAREEMRAPASTAVFRRPQSAVTQQALMQVGSSHTLPNHTLRDVAQLNGAQRTHTHTHTHSTVTAHANRPTHTGLTCLRAGNASYAHVQTRL